MCVCACGGILDQDVIHYDTWLRKHSQYAFTRLSARGLKYSALENSAVYLHRRSLEQVQRKRGVDPPLRRLELLARDDIRIEP